MKIKCAKLECETCSKLSSIQVFCNKSGAIKYARAKHYIGRKRTAPKIRMKALFRKLAGSGVRIAVWSRCSLSKKTTKGIKFPRS